jgi:hypothetical protein
MTGPTRPHRPAAHPTIRHARRGAAYVMVLSIGMLLSVVAFAVVASSRADSRTAKHAADADEAAALAESGVEWGLAAVGNDTSWRTTYAHNVEATPKAMGRGTTSFKLVAESGSTLVGTGNVRIYGIGRVGVATRSYSVLLSGTGATLDVLKTATHSAGAISVTGAMTLSGGTLSGNSTLAVGSGVTVTGAVEYVDNSGSGSGTVTGGRTTLAAPRAMPSADVFDTYKARATAIAYAGITSGSISKKVVSSTTNPYGTANADGIYYIQVPASSTLTVTNSRLVATLVVELGAGATVKTSGTWAWKSPRADLPVLIVKGAGSGIVNLGGSSSNLSELTNAVNFNPTGAPNAAGTTDADQSDSYPTKMEGLVHVIGSGVSSQFQTYFTLEGTAILDGTLTTYANVKLTADPTLATNPPAGYTAATTMVPSPASWKWEPYTP